uniref:Uncharacterized protein n=1 Tax=Rhizobium leguminosarum bv. viciae TaxID=387 RepID=A0A0U2YVC8_RHILV|nr:hypothetical protein [Rhizobium leguminosarum bv. viciae]
MIASRAPGGVVKLFGTNRTFPYVSDPEPGLAVRRIHVPQGSCRAAGARSTA